MWKKSNKKTKKVVKSIFTKGDLYDIIQEDFRLTYIINMKIKM